MSKDKKAPKNKNKDLEVWTEEQQEEYLKGLYGMEFIAGFTEGGVPYGLFYEGEEISRIDKVNKSLKQEEELPF